MNIENKKAPVFTQEQRDKAKLEFSLVSAEYLKTLDKRHTEHYVAIPDRLKRLFYRCFTGAASRTESIRAQCLACVGYSSKDVTDCGGTMCPLYAVRPYQKGE